MKIKEKDTINNSININKEKQYKRNFLSLALEGFFFTISLSIFSHENILPLYISNISNDKIYIALISAIFFGFSYTSSIFSSIIGVRAKSPKWIHVIISSFQRIAFLLILLSTYMISNNKRTTLLIFFIFYSIYSISAGMTNPVFTQMISQSIYRNVGFFYGVYSMSGAIGGLLASYMIKRIINKYSFPINFRALFLLGLIFALFSTFTVIIGVKEVLDDRKLEYVNLKDVRKIYRDIFSKNEAFNKYSKIRTILSITEFIVPYFIIFAKDSYLGDNFFIGNMTIIFLLSRIVSSLIFGKISDERGVYTLVLLSSMLGLISTVLTFFVTNKLGYYFMYALIASASNGVLISTNIACVNYSNNERTPFYMSGISLLCAPMSIFMPFFGAYLFKKFSYNGVFLFVSIIYAISFVLTFHFKNDFNK